MDKEDKALTGEDFESKIAELKNIVNSLESDIPLEDGMKLFESGIKLTKECIDDLNKAQKSIAELKSELDKILDDQGGE